MKEIYSHLKTTIIAEAGVNHNGSLDTAKELIYQAAIAGADLVKFQIEIPNEEILLPLNQQLFSWTLENLIKNGIDAIKGKGVIRVNLDTNVNWVIITVSDSGQGIKKELHKKIFSPGFTSKKRGWGLGLSLAKRIISDYHKGKISVKKSVLGKGSTFEILLKKNPKGIS